MNRKRNLVADRRRRKLFTILWTALLAIGVIVMIYFEQTALLYILATLGVTALLAVVALTDLHKGERSTGDGVTIDDAAAIGSGIASTSPRKP